jgi:hypothetical protein
MSILNQHRALLPPPADPFQAYEGLALPIPRVSLIPFLFIALAARALVEGAPGLAGDGGAYAWLHLPGVVIIASLGVVAWQLLWRRSALKARKRAAWLAREASAGDAQAMEEVLHLAMEAMFRPSSAGPARAQPDGGGVAFLLRLPSVLELGRAAPEGRFLCAGGWEGALALAAGAGRGAPGHAGARSGRGLRVGVDRRSKPRTGGGRPGQAVWARARAGGGMRYGTEGDARAAPGDWAKGEPEGVAPAAPDRRGRDAPGGGLKGWPAGVAQSSPGGVAKGGPVGGPQATPGAGVQDGAGGGAGVRSGAGAQAGAQDAPPGATWPGGEPLTGGEACGYTGRGAAAADAECGGAAAPGSGAHGDAGSADRLRRRIILSDYLLLAHSMLVRAAGEAFRLFPTAMKATAGAVRPPEPDPEGCGEEGPEGPLEGMPVGSDCVLSCVFTRAEFLGGDPSRSDPIRFVERFMFRREVAPDGRMAAVEPYGPFERT